MSPLAISCVAFVIICGGAALGLMLRGLLPDAHLRTEVKDVVRLSMGLIGTIAALVLGLLVASAKTSYDAKSAKIKEITANIILIDTFLQEYGPEALPARRQLRATVGPTTERIWNEGDQAHPAPFVASRESRALYDAIQKLAPATDAQRFIQSRVVALSTDLAQARLTLYTQAGNSIQIQFLGVLVFWLAMILLSFSLFVRPEPVTIAALLVCALSVAGALFLLLEMDRPFSGIMAISDVPMRQALTPLGGG